MKSKWQDLTVQEICDMTDERVEYYVEDAKLDAGIPIKLQRPEAPKLELPPKSVTVYAFQGSYYVSREQAQRVKEAVTAANALTSKSYSQADFESNYYPVVEDSWGMDITERKLWAVLDEPEVKRLKDAVDAEDAEYQERLREYRQMFDSFIKLESDIWNEVQHFRAMYAKVAYLEDRFADYLERADGNVDVAYSFFGMAYSADIKRLIDKSAWAEARGSVYFFQNMLWDHLGIEVVREED